MFAHDLAGTHVLHRTDSLSTYWVVANACSRRSERLSILARHIWLLCLQHSIVLACEYVGKDIINRKGADVLSRWQDCILCPDIFAALWRQCGPFEVDRFASASNVHLHPTQHGIAPSLQLSLHAAGDSWDGCLAGVLGWADQLCIPTTCHLGHGDAAHRGSASSHPSDMPSVAFASLVAFASVHRVIHVETASGHSSFQGRQIWVPPPMWPASFSHAAQLALCCLLDNT